MKIIIYKGDESLFTGNPVNLQTFFRDQGKTLDQLDADHVEIYSTDPEEPVCTMEYEELLQLL